MKKFILPIVLFALFSFTVSDTGLTDEERKLAITEMKTSHDRLLKSLKGLSEEQLNFKSSPDSWSIAECVEHLAISENNIFGMLEAALKTQPDASRRSEVQVSDEALLAMIRDRSFKAKAPEPFQPSGKFESYDETLREYKIKRAAHIKYVKKTNEDLRNRYQKLPVGTIDGFQILLFMSGHNDRHNKQIEEIIAHKDFPPK